MPWQPRSRRLRQLGRLTRRSASIWRDRHVMRDHNDRDQSGAPLCTRWTRYWCGSTLMTFAPTVQSSGQFHPEQGLIRGSVDDFPSRKCIAGVHFQSRRRKIKPFVSGEGRGMNNLPAPDSIYFSINPVRTGKEQTCEFNSNDSIYRFIDRRGANRSGRVSSPSASPHLLLLPPNHSLGVLPFLQLRLWLWRV